LNWRASLLLPLCALAMTAQTQTGDRDSMSLVPAGDFWMGRVHYFLPDALGWFERDRKDDFPAHRVYLDAFFIDRTEVTNEDYARYLAANSTVPKPWHWPGGRIPTGEEHFPVYNVDWHQASAYCGWAGKSLPTEAEWEKAARGTLDRTEFAWESTVSSGKGSRKGGSSEPKPANVASKGPIPVGKYPANGYGLYDMIGNVWEWTSDWYSRDYYSVSPRKNPKGPEAGMYKVFRGAAWIETDERVWMPSFRNYTDPVERSPSIGFRCAKPAE
jgi:formylglycine-generating enzyme required for sulfatase activity